MRLRQLELAVDAIKAEIYSDVDAYKYKGTIPIRDYDEVFEDDDGYPD